MPDETLLAEVTDWRREFHRHPELMFDVDRTANRVAELLRGFGCDEIVTDVGRNSVVGVIRGQTNPDSRTIGIRADMDALPIQEETGLPYASSISGVMHACGHDGHTAVLLGAVRQLAATRNFAGTLVAVFQPAEEGGGGAKVIVDNGLFERFGMEEIYALHNMPGMEVGRFAISDGVMLAASDRFDITISGKGGHAARPHDVTDPVIIAAQIVLALQTIVSRIINPTDPVVLSITSMHAGNAHNVIPGEVVLKGTARALSDGSRSELEDRVHEISQGIAETFGATAELDYRRGYPPTINHPTQAKTLGDAAARVGGQSSVDRQTPPLLGAEDFSYMLRECAGAYIFMGNGPSLPLHHPGYDFNDAALGHGIALWVELMTGKRN